MRRVTFSLALTCALVLALGGPAHAQPGGNQKLDLVLQRAAHGHPSRVVPVIVRAQAGALQAVQRRVRARGLTIRKQHALIGAFTTDVRVSDLAALANDHSILSMSIDATVSADARRDQQPANLEKLLAASDLRATIGAAPDALGVGIGVAIIDSGIAPLSDFVQIAEFRDFTRGGIVTTPFDDYGHGTHIAGLIASTGNLSGMRYVGVAPGVRLIGLKVLDRDGRGSASNVIEALEFVVANRARLGIDVVNLSLGHAIFQRAADDPLVQAVEAAARAGVVVVVSAGNRGQNPETKEIGYGGITSPGNAPSAITVGAEKTGDTVTRLDDTVAKFSSRGPAWFDGIAKPDIVAPGEALISDVPRSSTLFKKYTALRYLTDKGTFLKLSGTSMATAVASGVAALVLEANRNARIFEYGVAKPATFTAYLDWAYADYARLATVRPTLSPNAVKAILQYTAVPLSQSGEEVDALTQGTGGINAEGAIRVAALVNPTKPVATQWVSAPVTDRWSFLGGAALEWSTKIIWNNILITGNLLDVHQPAWDFNIVWGTSIVCSAPDTCQNLLWGALTEAEDNDNIVWGTFLEDADNIVWGTLSEDGDSIVWGTAAAEDLDNIVWGTNIVWESPDSWMWNIVWGTGLVALSEDADNIVWGTNEDLDNIVWGTYWTGLEGIVAGAGFGGGF